MTTEEKTELLHTIENILKSIEIITFRLILQGEEEDKNLIRGIKAVDDKLISLFTIKTSKGA
jgi:molecular chaperone GrpE (heat shock protein)